MNDYRKYLFTYRHDGAEWGLEIQAESPEDAKARVAKIAYATYEGEVKAKLPAKLSLLWRLGIFARNSIKALLPAYLKI